MSRILHWYKQNLYGLVRRDVRGRKNSTCMSVLAGIGEAGRAERQNKG